MTQIVKVSTEDENSFVVAEIAMYNVQKREKKKKREKVTEMRGFWV